MKLQIPTSEAVRLIKTKTGKNVALNTVNANTVNVCYEHKMQVPFFGERTIALDIDVTIEQIQGETLYLQYSSSAAGVDVILKSILTALPLFNDRRVVETIDGYRLKVNLNEIEKAREVMEKISINSISFSGGDIILDFNVK